MWTGAGRAVVVVVMINLFSNRGNIQEGEAAGRPIHQGERLSSRQTKHVRRRKSSCHELAIAFLSSLWRREDLESTSRHRVLRLVRHLLDIKSRSIASRWILARARSNREGLTAEGLAGGSKRQQV